MNAAEAAVCEIWHNETPLDGWQVQEKLAAALGEAKAERVAALALHDHARADAATRTMRDLTVILAAGAEGMARSRERFMAAGRWPLLPEPVPDSLA